MLVEVFTVKHDLSEITLKLQFDPEKNEGRVTGYIDEHCLQRAFFNRYDNMEINSEKDFQKRVKYYHKKSI
jgi:hypothetical protein